MNYLMKENADKGPVAPTPVREAPSSRIVNILNPLDKPNGNGKSSFQAAQRSAFKESLYATFKGEVEGALTPYLFYDPPEQMDQAAYASAWGSDEPVMFGAKAWDMHITESTSNNSTGEAMNSYGFANGDVEALETALQEGLVSRLPRNITYYGYGIGEPIAVSTKDCKLISAILENGTKMISSLNAVDLNDRYAAGGATIFHHQFNLESKGIQGDFMEGVLPLGNRVGTSLVGIFGGPFANAPNIIGGSTSKQKAVEYLSRLTEQHGLGTHILMTIDTQPNRNNLLKDYAKTRSFEAFLLSAFPRAVHEGIIQNDQYKVFKNWKMVSEYDQDTHAVKLIAECKVGHTIHTEDGDFTFSRKDQIVPILSNKWTQDEVREIFELAGCDDIKFYGNGSRKLVSARAMHEPGYLEP